MGVMGLDELTDDLAQLLNTTECPAIKSAALKAGKPALDRIEPRGAGGREVHDEARVLGQPLLDVGMLVGGVVVHDQVQLQVLGRLALDQAQEFEPLLMPVPILAHRDHGAVQCIERGKQQGYQTGWDEGRLAGWNEAVDEATINMAEAQAVVDRLRDLLRTHNIPF